MFGYVLPNEYALSDLQKKRYHAYYCGICHSLGKNHNTFCRSTLSYDMTFMALFLDGFMMTDNMTAGFERCVMKPKNKHEYYQGDVIDYAADMNIALTYHKLMDDWKDDRKLIRRGEAGLLKKSYMQIAEKYPRQCRAIEQGLKDINLMESRHETNPDLPTARFGQILGEVFLRNPDFDTAEHFRSFGDALGRFIYLMDAVMDLKDDLKKKRYNPLTAMRHLQPVPVLSLFLGDCIKSYEKLPKNLNHDLIENILYSGVWIAYAAENGVKDPAVNEEQTHDL